MDAIDRTRCLIDGLGRARDVVAALEAIDGNRCEIRSFANRTRLMNLAPFRISCRAMRSVRPKLRWIPRSYYQPPFNYGVGQMVEQALTATKSLD